MLSISVDSSVRMEGARRVEQGKNVGPHFETPGNALFQRYILPLGGGGGGIRSLLPPLRYVAGAF